MRRSGYSQIREEEGGGGDRVDGKHEDLEEETKFIDNRPEEKPYKTLLMVFFLFFMGLSTLTISTLIMLGHLHDSYADRMVPLFILGLLMFIPGAYYTRIVYLIVRGRPGYSYDMIPSCSDR